jgi:hypothetical protein
MNSLSKNPQRENAPLGNTTEFASLSEGDHESENSWSNVVTRYWLQSLARELLPRDSRIGVCMYCLSPLSAGVDVMKHAEGKRAYYSGLMVCGMIWVCSVCAARITEERRQELAKMLQVPGFTPYLITYTLRHKRADTLKILTDSMQDAFRFMKSGKYWGYLTDEYGWVGSIKTLEVTHGGNGWHPHQHELVLLDEPLSKSAQNGLLSDLRLKWDKALSRHGMDASWEHGVDLRATDEDVAEYVAKFGHQPVSVGWSIEHEMTKQPTKRGKKDGRTPAQLLSDYGMGDIRAGHLWREYARTFKGKKQLVWSKGLRGLLGMGLELPDNEIAQSLPQGTELLARLSPTEWRAVLKADLRGELLDAASVMEFIQFRRWLNEKIEKWL